MANQGSQASAIRDLLVQKLEYFDPSYDVSPGSPLYTQVVAPIFAALGTDPFDTDIETFLRDRLQQEFPSLSVSDGDTIVDMLIRPLQLLQEALKRETMIVRRGQSVKNSDVMRLEDAEALAANFFVTRRVGARASGTVRLYYSAPTYVSVLSTVVFSTPDGLRFFPIRPQFFDPSTVLLQRSGTFYYADVQLIAEYAGDQYNVGVGTITKVSGLPSVAKVSNLSAMTQGAAEETAQQLLARVGKSLTERSLNTRRGISARLFSDFPSVRSLEVVGYGDPEMNRDVITGSGDGSVIATGTCFIVGQFCLMFSQYEDRGSDGSKKIQVGDEIELNYWKFLYDVEPYEANETFQIQEILFDTKDIFEEQIPSILLFQMNGSPTIAPPIQATLPGVLPGVFAVVRTKGKLEISGIPGGILNPDSPRGTIEIEDNTVHIGGAYDVWVRPVSDYDLSTDLGVSRSERAFLEGTDLYTAGASPRFKNQVQRKITFDVTRSTVVDFQVGEILEGADGGLALIKGKAGDVLTLTEFNEEHFSAGEVVIGRTTGAQATINTIIAFDWEDYGILAGMLLSIVIGSDVGTYKILQVDGPYLYLDLELTSSEENLSFRVISDAVFDLFNPKDILFPFADAPSDDLNTVIGSETITVGADLLKFGVATGDFLEILDGDDKGIFSIAGFDSVLGGKSPILSAKLTSTASGLPYRVYRAGAAVQAPLVRILPNGVRVLDPNGQDSGNFVPYAPPVGARALEAFSGAGAKTWQGKNGFVLADPGPDFEPTGDLIADPGEFAEVHSCFSDGCVPYDGYIAVCTLTDDGNFYLNSNIPAAAQQFMKDLRDWLVDVVETLVLGDDVEAFIDGFHPFILGPPDTSVSNILLQFEICIPAEVFDGANNIFMALPEFDWKSEFEADDDETEVETVSFSDVLDKYNHGELRDSDIPPALMNAKPGSTLQILGGSNTGAYLIDKLYTYKLCHGGMILDEEEEPIVDISKAYDVALVVIRETFPVSPLSGLLDFFAAGVPTLTVPPPPDFGVECFDKTTGDPVDTWQVMQMLFTWIFQWLNAMGFDLPDSVTLNPGETLAAIWQLLFHEYIVGDPTCEQMIRVSFLEPTSFTAYEALPAVGFEWKPPAGTPARIVGGEITTPNPAFDNIAVGLSITDLVGTKTYYVADIGPAGAEATLEDLAGLLQSLLDPDISFFRITWSCPVDPAIGTLIVETVRGGLDIQLTLGDGFSILGFTTVFAVGGVEPGDLVKSLFIPPPATRFITVAGSEALPYVASGTKDPFQVYPGESQNGRIATTSLPRDILVGTPYENAMSTEIRFSDVAAPSPMEAGVHKDEDLLWLYEQRKFLEATVFDHEEDIVKDRVIAVTTMLGSNIVRLPYAEEPDFHFQNSTTHDPFDEVQVGDLVFIEEGDDAGGHTVIDRSEFFLTLGDSLTEGSGTLFRSGNDGDIEAGTHIIRSELAAFTSDDIGRFVTVWACNRVEYDGSYRITAVEDFGTHTEATLDTDDFVYTEQEIHWAVVKAPAEDPGSSGTEGRTALVGVRPVRIYNGIPAEFRVARVSPHLDRTLSEVLVAHEAATSTGANAPKNRVKQPYQFVRQGVQHLSSTAMKGQGRELGLYFFDVLSRSLFGGAIANIPQDTPLEPVFGTYDSDGYWLEVEDPNLVFSPQEKTKMIMSPMFLPVGYDDTIANKDVLDGHLFQIRYGYTPIIDQIQRLLISDSDRVLCSSPLARHFLPSYVYLDVSVWGGNTSQQIAEGLAAYIEGLLPTDPLDLSQLEDILQRNSVTRYDHPITLITLTHDLDRRIVMTRSVNRIGNDEVFYNGTNRTSFFIPGVDASAFSSESAIPDGERIYIPKTVPLVIL